METEYSSPQEDLKRRKDKDYLDIDSSLLMIEKGDRIKEDDKIKDISCVFGWGFPGEI